jgi:Zn-dependent protease with chaperone function
MSDIQIFLFGPDLPVAGQLTSCIVEQDAIHIQSPYSGHAIKFSELTAKVAGFDHNQLQLSWQHGNAKWSLLPIDSVEQKRLVDALPQTTIAGLKQWKRATQSQSFVWKAILYTCGFIGVSLVLLLWQHDYVTTWAANHVSMKTEKRLGESVLKSLNPKANFLPEGEAVKTVQSIGKQLTAGSAYQYQWYVSKDPTVNAFAIPGGIIVVNSGLLKKADSPNELAAVLAHEVQHVEQKHALKNMINSAGIAAVVLVVLGDTNAVVMLMAHQVSAQYFNRQIESDADLKGVQLLHKKNINAAGMVSFFKKMDAGFITNKADAKEKPKAEPSKEAQEADTKESDVTSWFSSHPDTVSRIQTVERYIAQHPCPSCKMLTWDKAAILANLKQANTEEEVN